MKVVSTTLGSTPLSARLARQFVVTTLTGWNAAHLIDTASLLTSELVTNAVLHADSEVKVRLEHDASLIRFEVQDSGRGDPVARVSDPYETSGRGLALVNTLSQAWGVSSLEPGKSVWFELLT